MLIHHPVTDEIVLGRIIIFAAFSFSSSKSVYRYQSLSNFAPKHVFIAYEILHKLFITLNSKQKKLWGKSLIFVFDGWVALEKKKKAKQLLILIRREISRDSHSDLNCYGLK